MKTIIFFICLIISFSSGLKAQVFWINTVSSTNQAQFYYIKNDTAYEGLFQAKETNLTLWGYLGELDKSFIMLGDSLEHIVLRWRHHAYIFFYESRIKNFINDFPFDTLTEVTEIFDEGNITIIFIESDPKGIVPESKEIYLSIKEGTITITYRKGLFKIDIRNLVLNKQ